jgi:hypothetical protein
VPQGHSTAGRSSKQIISGSRTTVEGIITIVQSLHAAWPAGRRPAAGQLSLNISNAPALGYPHRDFSPDQSARFHHPLPTAKSR